MATIPPISNAEGKTAEMLNAVKAKLGVVPNMMATMAQAPAVLESYLAFSGAMNRSSLSPTLREKIALVVGESNGCSYCVAAHMKLGSLTGASSEELTASRRGESSDPKEQAALGLAAEIVRGKGRVPADAIAKTRQAGYTDAQIAEIVAAVALNIFTNYFNHVADPEIDFPLA